MLTNDFYRFLRSVKIRKFMYFKDYQGIETREGIGLCKVFKESLTLCKISFYRKIRLERAILIRCLSVERMDLETS